MLLTRLKIFACICMLALADARLSAQGYQTPPAVLSDLITAQLPPAVIFNVQRTQMLLLDQPAYPEVEQLAQPELRLAGLRINPATRGPSRNTQFTGAALLDVATGLTRRITGLPDAPRLTTAAWGGDGKYVAAVNQTATGLELWLVDVAQASARKVEGVTVHGLLGSTLTWLPTHNALLVRTPAEMGAAPQISAVPTGPSIQENLGRTTPGRTFTDLLKNTNDERLFDYHARSQFVRVSLEGQASPVGRPGIFTQFNLSPDGSSLIVNEVLKPYSYLFPLNYFPRLTEVWDITGKVVATIAKRGMLDNLPLSFDAVEPGIRNVEWRADLPATLVYAEAGDGGNPATPAVVRDRLKQLSAPYTGEPTTLIELSYRLDNVLWHSGQLAIVQESWTKTRMAKRWRITPSNQSIAPVLMKEGSSEDRYNDPGNPVLKAQPNGYSLLNVWNNGKTIALVGAGASSEGDRPFIDEQDLATLKTTRWWRSEAPFFESVAVVVSPENKQIITLRQSRTEPPNYFARTLGQKPLQRQITQFADPQPSLRGLQKELITYKRKDGVSLSGTLYLPKDYTPAQGRLPVLMWAYPQEFVSTAAASQVIGSPYRFDRVSWGSPLFWALRGYAILDNPTMPIVGEKGTEPNDTYIEQLVASAKAAIDELARRGVGDSTRVAVGGHSYGAFMTANLLSHSNLFAAGIARSGAYNRSLTPFGFQAEERSYWQVQNIYQKMSPFNYAPQMKTPLLLIHGEADNNSGTFPIQSERYYQALKGHGATTRLVFLPLESHGYQGRQSVLHMLHEMDTWLETYVKNRKPKQ